MVNGSKQRLTVTNRNKQSEFGVENLARKLTLTGVEGVSYVTPPQASQDRKFMSTFFAKKEEQKPRWYVIDASNQVLGKVAVRAANVLRGKVKPTFTPHVDAGDFVVVVNAEKVVLTGKKETAKTYMSYSQYPGKEKRRTVKQVRASHPEKLIEHAVKGMIPHNRLGRAMITKLKVYAGAVHPHVAQKPEPITI